MLIGAPLSIHLVIEASSCTVFKMVSAFNAVVTSAVATVLILRLLGRPGSISSYLGVFVVLLLSEASCFLIWKHFLRPFYFSPLRNVPEPKGANWLFGHGTRLMGSPEQQPIHEWMREIPNNGLIRYLTFFNLERVVATTPEAISETLVAKSYEFEKPSMVRTNLGRLTGYGLVLAEGETHRFQRRNLQPAFAFRHVKELYPMFWQQSCSLVDALSQVMSRTQLPGSKEESLMGEIEMSGWAARLTLDIIGQAACGLDFGALDDPNNRLSQAYKSMLTIDGSTKILAILSLLIPSDYLQYIPTRTNNGVWQGRAVFRQECIRIIQTKKRLIANKQDSGIDILSVAMQSGAFTDDGLIDQLMTFLLAGHETTANATDWALYFLACYPEIQQRLREEVRSHIAPPSTPEGRAAVDHTIIDSLPYLRAFCSETLRYMPSVPLTFREVVGDKTTIAGTRIPKGTIVVIPISPMQRTPQFWGANADAFNPERWMGEKNVGSGGAVSHLAFLTFLHGPRSCIGQTFARAEFACIVAALVGSFEWDLKDQSLKDLEKMLQTMRQGITLRFTEGLHMKVKRLDGW